MPHVMQGQSAVPVNWRGWLLAAVLALSLHVGLLWALAGEEIAPQFRIARDITVTLIKTAIPRTRGAPSTPAEPKAAPTPSSRPDPVTEPTPEPSQEEVRQPHQKPAPATTATSKNGDAAQDSPAQRMLPDSEPDYSASFLNNTPPRYPKAAQRRGWQGSVVLKVEVLATGLCGQVEVLHSSGHEILDDAALETVKQWHFVPASHAGHPVDRWFRIPVRFRLSSSI